MSINSDIRDGIIQIVKSAHLGSTNDANACFTAEVLDVDIKARTCSVMGISSQVQMEYTGVWLMPQIDDGILYVPTVGSTVIVGNNENLQPYILMFSQLDQILYVVNATTFSMTDGLTKFNKGDNDGLVNIKPLVTKINNLEKLVNDLTNKYNAHTHILTLTSGSGTAAITTSQETGSISPLTAQSDLEDTTVTH